jgi:ketosteroid isomerase-like protein
MSQEQVQLVHRVYADDGNLGVVVNPDDERAVLDRLFRDYYVEDFEVRMPSDYPEGEQVLRGREGMSRLSAMLRDTWSEFRFKAERVLDAGDRVVVLVRVVAEGGVSGIPTERETAHVWTARHGRLASIQIYRDRADALKAAGLEG